jgi:hypothetical protein
LTARINFDGADQLRSLGTREAGVDDFIRAERNAGIGRRRLTVASDIQTA